MILSPQPAVLSPLEINKLIDLLQQRQIIDAPISHLKQAWSIGDHFMNDIIFMGCSPYIKLEPEDPEDQDFCHIQFKIYTENHLLFANNSRSPQCPQCAKRHPTFLSDCQMKANNKTLLITDKTLLCPLCNTESPIEQYRWGKNGGIGQFFIQIAHIFPNEAVPSDQLLTALEKITQSNWQTFYLHLD